MITIAEIERDREEVRAPYLKLLAEASACLKRYDHICEALEMLKRGERDEGQLNDAFAAVIEPAFDAILHDVGEWRDRCRALAPDLDV